MPMTIDEKSLLQEYFLENSRREIIEIGRELLSCIYGFEQDRLLCSICNRLRRVKENAQRLNFKKIEKISNVLENILRHIELKKLPVDGKLIEMCLHANNTSCDILKSIEASDCETSEKYSDVFEIMMRYVDKEKISL